MSLLGTIVLATEAGAEAADSSAVILPAPAEMIWGLVGFALLMAILWGRVFPTLNATLEKRRAAIEGQIKEAEDAKASAEESRRKYDAQLADARGEAGAIIDEAKGRAERLRADILAKAEEEAEGIRQRARQEQEQERARLLQGLRGQVATISVELAGRIMDAEIDPARHEQLVDRYLRELSGLN